MPERDTRSQEPKLEAIQVAAYWFVLFTTLVATFIWSRGRQVPSDGGYIGKLLTYEQNPIVLLIGAATFAIFSWNARFKGLPGIACAFLLGGLVGRLLRFVVP